MISKADAAFSISFSNEGFVMMWIVVSIILLVLIEGLFLGYHYGIGPLRFLNDIKMKRLPGNAKTYSMQAVRKDENSPLKGCRVLFLGSSVTYGAASQREGIPEYFAARFGCIVTKEAVSGTTLVNDSKGSYVYRLMHNVDTDHKYALAVVQLSTNDASQNKPLGNLTDSLDPSTFDSHTVTGAIETIIDYIRSTWQCPVVFYTNARYESRAYTAMVQRLMELKEKWNIGILNLWTDDRFNTITQEERTLYMYDSIHPTKAGYREWWCPELERQLQVVHLILHQGRMP